MTRTYESRIRPCHLALGLLLAYACFGLPAAHAQNIVHVVAAENSYAGMVKSIGGDRVDVVSLLDSPNVNPHQFEASPQIGRQLQNADLVVMNGLGYDSWMDPLLEGTSGTDRRVIKASDAASALLMADNNPHIFYSPRIMLATASRVAAALGRIDPDHQNAYQANLQRFQKSLLPIYAQVQAMIAAHPDLTVTATVPIYAYMVRLLGYRDRYHDIQFASMDNSQPSARQVKQFMQALQRHTVSLLIYNTQVRNRLTQSEVETATQAGCSDRGRERDSAARRGLRAVADQPAQSYRKSARPRRRREMNPPAITVRNLAAGKGRENAFHGLSFEIAPQSFTALVGPNGCGKTTLFEALLGLIRLRAGAVDILGRTPKAARSDVAYVPQASRLTHDGQFIGREFVAAAYNGRRWGMTRRWRAAARAIDRALEQVGARDLARRRLAELSGGQRQRLLIAQALVNQPKLVFMDEPLAGLDPGAQERIVACAAALRDTLGIAVLFSTHDVNPVVEAADGVLYLAGGQGRIGPIDEVLTDDTLSALYGVPMHVVREHGQVFVMQDQTRPAANTRVTPLAGQRRRA